MNKQHGMALIIALWALALLSLMMAAVVQAIRLENRQSAYQLQHVRAQLAAEAGLALTMRALISSPAAMIADGRPYSMTFNNVQLTIKVFSDRGKLDMNFATLENLGQVARYEGATPIQAQLLTDSLKVRRTNNHALRAIEELQQFPGMAPQLYDRLTPYLTLWTGMDQPDLAFAQEGVKSALGLVATSTNRNPGTVFSAQIHAALAPNYSAKLNVTFFFPPQGDSAQLYRVLRWQE